MTPEIRKQIMIYVPLSEWKALYRESARLKKPITALIKKWIAPHVDKLTTKAPKGDEE